MSDALSIIIADDHPLVRGALHQSLNALFPNAVIGEAETLEATLERVGQQGDVDLVLLDLTMPGMNGFTGLFTLRSQYPAVPVAIFSAHQDAKIVKKAIAYGASAYVPKSAPVAQIGEAVKHVLNGNIWLPDWAEDAIARLKEDQDQKDDVSARLAQLTPQQLRVLTMLTEGKLNKQIAYELDVTEATIKAHVSAILRKLGVHSRTQAVIIARELEIEEPKIEA